MIDQTDLNAKAPQDPAPGDDWQDPQALYCSSAAINKFDQ
jgi:hypothetical protein